MEFLGATEESLRQWRKNILPRLLDGRSGLRCLKIIPKLVALIKQDSGATPHERANAVQLLSNSLDQLVQKAPKAVPSKIDEISESLGRTMPQELQQKLNKIRAQLRAPAAPSVPKSIIDEAELHSRLERMEELNQIIQALEKRAARWRHRVILKRKLRACESELAVLCARFCRVSFRFSAFIGSRERVSRAEEMWDKLREDIGDMASLCGYRSALAKTSFMSGAVSSLQKKFGHTRSKRARTKGVMICVLLSKYHGRGVAGSRRVKSAQTSFQDDNIYKSGRDYGMLITSSLFGG